MRRGSRAGAGGFSTSFSLGRRGWGSLACGVSGDGGCGPELQPAGPGFHSGDPALRWGQPGVLPCSL